MQNQSLVLKFRSSCIYTWVNVNLNLAQCRNRMFPKIHISLFTESVPSRVPSPSLTAFFFTENPENILLFDLSSVIPEENSPKCKYFANRRVFFWVFEK